MSRKRISLTERLKAAQNERMQDFRTNSHSIRPDDGPDISPDIRPDDVPDGRTEHYSNPTKSPNVRPDNSPNISPNIRPDKSPVNGPNIKPDVSPVNRPAIRPGKRQANRPAIRPDDSPDKRLSIRSDIKPDEWMTENQIKIFYHLRKLDGKSTRLEDICQTTGVAYGTLRRALRLFQKKGYIEKPIRDYRGSFRGLKIKFLAKN